MQHHPEVGLEHRCFALAPTLEAIVAILGSKEAGKREILEHWRAANANDDEHRIHADLMVSRDFDHPYSMPGLLACEAAEWQGGQGRNPHHQKGHHQEVEVAVGEVA